MHITITGCRYAPTWDTLQTMIRETMPDGPSRPREGQITRINRLDGGTNYRGLGEYDLTYQMIDCHLPISLSVLGLVRDDLTKKVETRRILARSAHNKRLSKDTRLRIASAIKVLRDQYGPEYMACVRRLYLTINGY